MGMFDWYEPDPAVPCPSCASPLTWQGYQGPNALLLWRQGERFAVDQLVDAEAKVDPEERSAWSLPPVFRILGWCGGNHVLTGDGRTADGVWTTLELTPGPKADHPPDAEVRQSDMPRRRYWPVRASWSSKRASRSSTTLWRWPKSS
jgi:hypothetical protein